MDRDRHATLRESATWTTADDKSLKWSEIKDSHLLFIVRHLVRRARQMPRDTPSIVIDGEVIRFDQRSRARRQLSIAVDEVAWRGLLPTLDELRVSWDRAHSREQLSDKIKRDDPMTGPWCLVDLWVGYQDKMSEPAVYTSTPVPEHWSERESADVATFSTTNVTARELAETINAATNSNVSADYAGDRVTVTFNDSGSFGTIVVSEQPMRPRVARTRPTYTSRSVAGPSLHRRLSR